MTKNIQPQLEDKLNASTAAMNKPCNDQENVEPNIQPKDDLLSAAQLKKKDVNSKSLRRKKTWLDKLQKGKRKPTKSAGPKNKGAKQNGGVQTPKDVENNGSNKGAIVDAEEYSIIDKLNMGKRKPTKSAIPAKKGGAKQQNQNDGVQPQKEVENDCSKKGAIMEVQECNVIDSFTQLVTAPICDDDILQIDLF